MDITPTELGAQVDVTDLAVDSVLEMVAEAWGREPELMADLLASLADELARRKNLRAMQAAGRDVSDQYAEEVGCAVDGARDALAGHLSSRVVMRLGWGICFKDAQRLAAAGYAAQKRFRTPGQPVPALPVWMPQQADRRDAA
jgi:hypothetical protein